MNEIKSSKHDSQWKLLASLPSTAVKSDGQHNFVMQSYYVDVNGKEWIVFLLHRRLDIDDNKRCDSFLYDIDNDKFCPFIKDYQQDLIDKFDLLPITSYDYTTYAIDRDNGILYWFSSLRSTISITSINIKNLEQIKLIDQTVVLKDSLSSDLEPLFSDEFLMLIVEDTLQFILGANRDGNMFGSSKHFQFDIKTKKFSIMHQSIHSQKIKRVTKLKIHQLFDNIKVGDCIDVRFPRDNRWYLGQIYRISDRKYCTIDDKFNTGKKERLESMWIYVGCKNLQGAFWIEITRGRIISMSSLCDCNQECNNEYHKIALAKSQSFCNKFIDNFQGLYSNYDKKMIILGNNGLRQNHARFGGWYYKYANDKCKKQHYRLIAYGFIRRVVKKMADLFIPKDLRELILKYYFIPNENGWEYVIKKQINVDGDEDTIDKILDYDNVFYSQTTYVSANQGDIYMFGGKTDATGEYSQDIRRLNIKTQATIRLTSIKCPKLSNKNDYWHGVFCNKSQTIHLFQQTCHKHYSIKVSQLNNAESALI